MLVYEISWHPPDYVIIELHFNMTMADFILNDAVPLEFMAKSVTFTKTHNLQFLNNSFILNTYSCMLETILH